MYVQVGTQLTPTPSTSIITVHTMANLRTSHGSLPFTFIVSQVCWFGVFCGLLFFLFLNEVQHLTTVCSRCWTIKHL